MHRYRLPSRRRLYRNERGMILVLALALLSILTVAGMTAVTMTSTDLLVGGNYKASQLAFYNAEAGVQYVLASLPSALSSGTLALNGEQESEDYTIGVPTGFVSETTKRKIGTTEKEYLWFARKEDNALFFEVDPVATFTRLANTRKYFFQVTGRPQLKSAISSTVEVVLQRASLLPYGMFGDERVDLPTAGGVYSYDSRVTANPTSAGSTGEARIGSNGKVSAYNSGGLADIDGFVALGDNGAGTEGLFEFKSPYITYLPPDTIEVGPGVNKQKIALTDVDRVNPDPLNASARVDAKSGSNDNAAVGEISQNQLLLSGNMTLGAGDYYLTAMTLTNGANLTIDPGEGIVNIYLDGKLEALSGSQLSILGSPTQFRIFSKSQEPLTFWNDGDFKGLVYAPFASVAMKNMSMKAYGLLWAKKIDMVADVGPVEFYVDTALYDVFLATDVVFVSWKDLRN